MKILIVGSTGLLGSSFKGDFLRPSRELFDITSWRKMDEYLYANPVDIIVNCAAVVGTVECEKNKDLAHNINAFGVLKLVDLCKKYKIKLIHISTIYSGTENIYSKTKLLSEDFARRLNNHAVIRLPWLFGKSATSSFVSQMIGLVKDGLDLELFPDEGHVAYVQDVAEFITEKAKGISGTFDLYNDGDVTKKDIAKYISNFYNKPVLIKEVPRRIPLVMHPHETHCKLRPWQEALEEHLNELRAMQPAAEDTLAPR